MNETCPTCEKPGYRRCEGEVGYDIQSGQLQCRDKATHYVKTTNRKTGVSETVYLCGIHYGSTIQKSEEIKHVWF